MLPRAARDFYDALSPLERVRAALELASAAGLRRVWSMTASDNRAALRLQQSCGFRVTKSVSFEAELEIDLSASLAARVMPQAACIPHPASTSAWAGLPGLNRDVTDRSRH
jgi:hypothetical protein